jgi:nucleoside-diphosphate-sugar epimerase
LVEEDRVRILVTGATGFVASHLVPALASAHEVYALGHDESRIAGGGIPVVRDLRLADATSDLPDVDAVIHLAQANVPFPDGANDLVAVNTSSTVALLDYARKVGATRFVYASSASVYGAGDEPWVEDDVPAAPDFYSRTKLAGERFVLAYQPFLATSIFRLVAPYGPGQRNRMIPRLITSVRDGQPIKLNDGGRPRMNPIYVDDVLATVDAVLESDDHHLLNLAGDDVVSIEEIAEAAGRALDQEPVFEHTGGAAGDIVCDNRRLHKLLGSRSLVGIEDGVAQAARVSAQV